jgi:hypothetical protein
MLRVLIGMLIYVIFNLTGKKHIRQRNFNKLFHHDIVSEQKKHDDRFFFIIKNF